jgi:hypothetical protein
MAQKRIAEMQEREESLQKDIKKISGEKVDIWAAASIARAFDKLKIEYPRTDKGAPSFPEVFSKTTTTQSAS